VSPRLVRQQNPTSGDTPHARLAGSAYQARIGPFGAWCRLFRALFRCRAAGRLESEDSEQVDRRPVRRAGGGAVTNRNSQRPSSARSRRLSQVHIVRSSMPSLPGRRAQAWTSAARTRLSIGIGIRQA
jgi:hypothetical protein